MGDGRYIHIRNWDLFQHRDVTRNKKTAAPWIRDHIAQLTDDDWRNLTQSQCGILQGLRLMYATRRGRGIDEAQAKHELCRSRAEARHWRGNIEALNHAGFIMFSARNLLADSRATRAQPARLDVDVDKDIEQTQGLTASNSESTGPGINNLDHALLEQFLDTEPDPELVTD